MDAVFNQADLANLIQRFRDIERRHLPDVTRSALNDMAFKVHAENKVLMERVFDQPTRFTLNAFWVRKATRSNPVAVVERKPVIGRKHYLAVQQDGGARGQTGLEKRMTYGLAYEGLIQSVLPASIRKDSHGNIAPGALQRLMSGTGIQVDRWQNRSATGRRRAEKRNKYLSSVYFVPDPDSHLSPGVYERGMDELIKIVHFSERVPTYTPRFPMEDHAKDVAAAEAPTAVERALRRALAGMR